MPCLECLFHRENHIEVASIVICVEIISRQNATCKNIWKKSLDFFWFLVRDLDISNNFYKIQNLHYWPVIPVNQLVRRILKALSPFQLHKRLTKTHFYAFFEGDSFSANQNALKFFLDYMIPGTHSHIIYFLNCK